MTFSICLYCNLIVVITSDEEKPPPLLSILLWPQGLCHPPLSWLKWCLLSCDGCSSKDSSVIKWGASRLAAVISSVAPLSWRSWEDCGSRWLLIPHSRFLDLGADLRRGRECGVACLGVIPFLLQMRLFLFQAYFWMTWASFEARLGSVAQS